MTDGHDVSARSAEAHAGAAPQHGSFQPKSAWGRALMLRRHSSQIARRAALGSLRICCSAALAAAMRDKAAPA